MAAACVLALDLGTTAFKAAPVDAAGLLGRVTVIPYALDYGPAGTVTCPPERYVRCALRALRGAAQTAREQGLTVTGIGLSSQAQTYIAIDQAGRPVAPAVVWTDARAVAEAEIAALALPDYAATCGFVRPSPLQFLPKVMHFRREGGRASRLLLLNEWIVYRLTGDSYGDATNQGLCGFYDIAARQWNARALGLAGLTADHLAEVAPAATRSSPLSPDICGDLGLPAVPVYSCGNDQSCAAVGAGIEDEGDLFCNFGTALVLYMLRRRPAQPTGEDQIAGISPLASRWYLLGLESECGNVFEWLARLLYPRGGVGRMIEAALAADVPGDLPQIRLTGGGRLDLLGANVGCGREELARALLEHFSARFGELLAAWGGPRPRRAFVGGGLSRSAAWIRFLGERHGLELIPAAGEHPGLVGVARIIQRATDQPAAPHARQPG